MCKGKGASAIKFTDTHPKFCDLGTKLPPKSWKKKRSFIDNSL